MLLCAFSVNYATASGRTDRPRYGPALEIVDRSSARFRGTKTVSQAWTFQTLNEGVQASRAYRGAPSVVDMRRELHPVNWLESFKSPQANLSVLENYFAELAERVVNEPGNVAALSEIGARYGITLLGPPIAARR